MTASVTRVRAPNPGPMTLDGTNSYIVGAGTGSSAGDTGSAPDVIVVDPGPDDSDHLDALAAAGRVALILLTHHHEDHAESRERFARMTGADVRAIDPALCIGASALTDDEVVEGAGVRVRVVATPGHTADSACFVIDRDPAVDAATAGPTPTGLTATGEPTCPETTRTILTGDTILGVGTTIISSPDGSLGAYLDSLERLKALGPARVLPGHGPSLPDIGDICDAYLAHRHERLAQIRGALSQLGVDATVAQVTDLVYADVDPAVRFAAEASVAAQLHYVRTGI